MNREDLPIIIVVGIAVLALFALLAGMFVYNHSQDIGRDEFYATHCKNVTKAGVDNGFSTPTVYQCGAKP